LAAPTLALREFIEPCSVAAGQKVDEQGGKLARRRYQRGQLLLKQRGEEKIWIGRWREDVFEDGHVRRIRRTENLGTLNEFRTKKLARRELDRRIASINDPNYRPRVVLTFAEFLERWQQKELVNLKPSTATTMRSQIRRHLVPLLGDAQLSEITAERIQGAFVNVTRTRSPKTVLNLRATLQIVWRSAQAWGYVTHNAIEGVRVPRRGRVERFFFSLAETRKILSNAAEPQRTIYWLAAETGMLAALRWADVDLDALTVRVTQSAWRGKVQDPKTANALRCFALSPQLAAHLRLVRSSWRPNPGNLVFASRNGTPVDMNLLVKRKLHPLLASLGIVVPKRTGLHALRHFAASIMDRLAVPLKLRQQRLGHSDPRLTLSVYTHVASEDDVRLANKLGELLDPAEMLDSVGPAAQKGKALSEGALEQGQWIQ